MGTILEALQIIEDSKLSTNERVILSDKILSGAESSVNAQEALTSNERINLDVLRNGMGG